MAALTSLWFRRSRWYASTLSRLSSQPIASIFSAMRLIEHLVLCLNRITSELLEEVIASSKSSVELRCFQFIKY